MARRKKVTPELIAQLQASGDTTRLLEIMRDKTMPPKARLEAAKAAAPFFHTPISPIDDDDEDGSRRSRGSLIRINPDPEAAAVPPSAGVALPAGALVGLTAIDSGCAIKRNGLRLSVRG